MGIYVAGKICIDGQRFSAGSSFPSGPDDGDVVCERYPIIDFAADVFDLSGQIWMCFFLVSVDDRYLTSEM